MVDIDALIDSATPQPLPEDVKVAYRAAARTRPTARARQSAARRRRDRAAARAGGPRRPGSRASVARLLEHVETARRASLPPATAARWLLLRAWGAETVAAAEHGWSAPPPIDLSFAAEPDANGWAEARSLAPRHYALARGSAVEDLPGFRDGGW